MRTLPVIDRALFQTARLRPTEAGAARSSNLRKNSGWPGTALGSFPTARATALSAQTQSRRFRSGSASSAWIRAIRSAKVLGIFHENVYIETQQIYKRR